MNWLAFTSSLIGAVLGSGFVGILLQAYLSHKFSEKLERLKTSLSAELFERQTRFAWLHTERSKVFVQLYRMLSATDRAFKDMLHPIQQGGGEPMKENMRHASEAANAFFEFYEANSVFFNLELVQKLRKLEEEYRRVWSTFVPNADFLPRGAEWADAWNKLWADVTPIRAQIERIIQDMLGVEREAPSEATAIS